MKQEWRDLEEFSNYTVSNYGEFANLRTGAEVRPSANSQGHAKVTLVQDRRQITRSVAQLVAQAFVPKPYPHYDTVIHLNGDLKDCLADNLLWRPRWYAIKFHQQFYVENFHNAWHIPLEDIETGEQYGSVKEAAIKNGLHWYDIVKSFTEEVPVDLTYQEFRQIR